MSRGARAGERAEPGAGHVDEAAIRGFRAAVLGRYRAAGRSFPWRETRDPWAILVSEIMLQQTQTARVVPKYLAWMDRFPDPASLASAPLSEALALWSGLGYNRRALALVEAARALVERFGGEVPEDEEALRSLPGVGEYTARAVLAFAFGKPSVFFETNIRTAFLAHFLEGEERVPDSRIAPFAEAALDRGDPRTWYYALMDYGAELKRGSGNHARRSSTYARQSPFENSHRRVRGAVLRRLGESGGGLDGEGLAAALPFARERVERAVAELVAEGFLERYGDRVRIRT